MWKMPGSVLQIQLENELTVPHIHPNPLKNNRKAWTDTRRSCKSLNQGGLRDVTCKPEGHSHKVVTLPCPVPLT